jgi:hypothetical protein
VRLVRERGTSRTYCFDCGEAVEAQRIRITSDRGAGQESARLYASHACPRPVLGQSKEALGIREPPTTVGGIISMKKFTTCYLCGADVTYRHDVSPIRPRERIGMSPEEIAKINAEFEVDGVMVDADTGELHDCTEGVDEGVDCGDCAEPYDEGEMPPLLARTDAR